MCTKKSRSVLALLLSAALLLSVLSACGSGGEAQTERSVPEPAQGAEVETETERSEPEPAQGAEMETGDEGAEAAPAPDDIYDVSGVDFSNPEFVIAEGDYDGMLALSRSIQNYELEGAVVEIDGEMGMSFMSHTIVVPNSDGSQKVGTTFQVIGLEDGDYPDEGSAVHIVGVVRPLSEYVHGIVVPEEYFSAEAPATP